MKQPVISSFWNSNQMLKTQPNNTDLQIFQRKYTKKSTQYTKHHRNSNYYRTEEES